MTLKELLVGFGTQVRSIWMIGLHAFAKRETRMYPEEPVYLPPRYRGRIVLTRDRGLLQHRAISHACYLHAIAPDPQFRELVARLALRPGFLPFTRCLACNAPLAVVDNTEVLEQLPPSVSSVSVV